MDWMTLLQGGGIAGIIFMLGANWMKLNRVACDIEELKRVTAPFLAFQSTLTHQHEWLERHERELHDILTRTV